MKDFIKLLSKDFIIGVLAVIPVVIVLQVVLFVERLMSNAFFRVYGYVDNLFYTFLFFVIGVSLLIYIGHFVATLRQSIVITALDLLLEKIPLLNSIYRVSKKVMTMFRTDDGSDKKEVVYIEYPNCGLWVPAYVTNKEQGWYILYVPTSPNPTSGFTVIVHESKVIRSALNVGDVTRFIVSVGVDYPKAEEVVRLPRD